MPNKSESAKSGVSRLGDRREDIENIFPSNMAPWNHPEDPQLRPQYIKPPLFRFEGGINLIPWRIRILLGLGNESLGPVSTRRLRWGEIGFDKLNRKSVWRKFGQTLHFATLEFADVSLEKGYQMDYASRSHQYVQICGVFVALVCALAIGRMIETYGTTAECTLGESILANTMFYEMLLGIIRSMISLSFISADRFKKWLLGNFQLFQTTWACMGLLLCLSLFYFSPFPDCRVRGEEANTYTVLVVIVSVFFRLRFIYLFFVLVFTTVFILCIRWSSPAAGIAGVFDILMMVIAAVGSLCAVYFVEVMLRKDFVQSLAVMTESQRSERLLRNVLPKRIIDTLKRRQDGPLTNASVANPGATALFTRTGGSAMPDHSRMLVSNVNGSWLNRASQAGSYASRFESRLGNGGLANTALAEAFDSVTILFADVVGFTKISSRVSPEQLVLLLNELFTVFDNLADANGLEKIKTIGDAFMAAAGLPNPHPLHAHAAARMALQMMDAVTMFCDDLGNPLQIRIGIHSGSAVAGVIGRRKFIYDVWGDCVNTASRMESHGEPMRVHCSQATAEKIQLDFDLESRGTLDIKGKGQMTTYFINGETAHSKYRSVLPADISQWRDRFSSTESVRRGSLQDAPTDEEDDDPINEDEVF